MWVRNAWYVAAWRNELAAGQIMARTIMHEPLVLYRKVNGAVVTLEDRCCHRLAPLSKGRLEQDDLRCMYHGLKFAADGRCIEIPGQPVIPPNAMVRTYPVAESGAWIWVWMGDAAAADPALIPYTTSEDDPDWHIRTGCLDYAANYQLINDNLLDLSHLSYAHEKTLGRGAPAWANQRPRVTRLDRGLRFQRWFTNHRASHYMRAHGEVLELWHSYDFLVPGLFLQRPAWYPLGSAVRANHTEPTEPPIFVRLDDQAVTPVTERTSRYYYAVGLRSRDGSAAMAEEMFRFTETAFHEDKGIIEAQQQVIDLAPERRMMSTSLDAGPTQFRRLVDELIARETARPRHLEGAKQPA
jgi:phenylpropionate dioxygenase-like ring-hydroxylating dioxygenase large terminal subunit